MIKTLARLRRNSLSLVLIALVALLSSARSASATVLNFENLVNLNSSLLNHYTFEGNTVAEREEDKKGSLDLDPVTYGTATASMIQYVTGFDATTTAVVPARPGGDTSSVTDNGGLGGAGLSTKAGHVSYGGTGLTATVEVLFRPDRNTLSGANGGFGFVAAVREQASQRGYFLFQGAAGTTSANDMSAYSGDPFTNPASQQTILGTLQTGHWYYYATTFNVPDVGMGLQKTEITSYIADLTAGQTTLTSLGTFTTPVGSLFTNGVGGQSPLGVGIVDITGYSNNSSPYTSAFPGGIDALALYSGAINQNVLQSHLDAIWLQPPGPVPAPEPGSFALMFLGLAGLALRRRTSHYVVENDVQSRTIAE